MDRRGRHPGGGAAETEGRLTSTPGPAQGPGTTLASSAPTAQPAGAEDLRLPKPPGFIRAWLSRHPWLLDGFIAGGYGLPTLAFALLSFVTAFFGFSPFGEDTIRNTPVFAVLLLYVTAAVVVALLFRRHVPVITAAICTAALLLPTTPTQQLDAIPMMFALYALAVYRSSRSAWLWTGIASATGGVATFLYDPAAVVSNIAFTVLFVLLMLIATLVGITFGNRRRYIQALLDRAEQLARERDQRAKLATADERARITREMHDIVAHSLTVIVSLSDGAAASVERSPAAAAEAMRQTGATARRALTDMRRSLGLLDPAAPLAPQPGLAELPELIASYRAAGLTVRYTAAGTPPADPLVQLTVYRVLQEAFTNALRYAVQATAVDAVVVYAATGIEITVTDDGLDPGRGAASTGSGQGLIGMRERVAAYGGTVAAGPVGARGWRVAATLGPSAIAREPGGPAADEGGREG
ncbi:sensor histidine kinase [Herbiconiux sp. YIM B11900]|uniref:sensor histidine kinase n=1 Tax=Herbiconiux sp. YIM B11900 TaxID=3404131 RepID=UPI003F82B50F